MVYKEDDCEYIWEANPKYWGRHTPVLFPIVGALKDDQYLIDGEKYDLTQHGFARDSEFDLVEKKENSLQYSLKYNEETLQKYPYRFELKIKYSLAESKVNVTYLVKNLDEQEIYFSIGAHPGFRCPLLAGEKMEDYYLEFENQETVDRYILDDDGLLMAKTETLLAGENKLNLTPELFKGDALILKDLESEKIAIKSNKNDKSITVEFAGFPYLGIWSKADRAPFICIEPWYGVADTRGKEGDFKDKEGIMKLNSAQEFEAMYSIKFE